MANFPFHSNLSPGCDPIIVFKVSKNGDAYKISSSWDGFKTEKVEWKAFSAKEIADAMIENFARTKGMFGFFGPFSIYLREKINPNCIRVVFATWENMTDEEINALRQKLNFHLQKVKNLLAFL